MTPGVAFETNKEELSAQNKAELRALANTACMDCVTVNFSSSLIVNESIERGIPHEIVKPIYQSKMADCSGGRMVKQTGCSKAERGELAPECGHPDAGEDSQIVNGVRLAGQIAEAVLAKALDVQSGYQSSHG